MRPLQIVLFLIANLIFITQEIRHVHVLVFGAERSVLEQFERGFTDKEHAREEKDRARLLREYEEANTQIQSLEQGKNPMEMEEIRTQHREEYERRSVLRTEIQEREGRSREIRDLWFFAGLGIVLIVVGGLTYRAGWFWAGFSWVVAGFIEIEYWASPTFFGGGASGEFRVLLIQKIVLTALGLGLLYTFWALRAPVHRGESPTVPA